MIKLRKVIGFIFLVIFILVLVSCDKDTQQIDSQDKTNNITNTSIVKVKDLRDEIYPSFDMGGRTINIAVIEPYTYDSSHDSIEDIYQLKDQPFSQMKLDNIRRIEKKYNVKIDFHNITRAGLETRLYRTVESGKPDMDIYYASFDYILPAIIQGMIMPIKDYAPDYCDIVNDRVVMDSVETFGDEYLITSGGSSSDMMSSIMDCSLIAYNKDILNSLELEDPKILYDKGEWTWDKFAEYAKLATKDNNGDHIIDQYGFITFGELTDFNFIYSNNGILANNDKENLSSINVMEAFEYLDRLYNIDNSTISIFLKNNDISFGKGDSLFLAMENLLNTEHILRKEGSIIDYGVVPYPQGPKGDGSVSSSSAYGGYVIPRGVEKPEQVYQIFEEYSNWFNYDTSVFKDFIHENFIESYNSIKKEHIELAIEVNKKVVFDFGFIFYRSLKEYYDKIIDDEMSVEEATEIYKVEFQEKIDKIFKR